MVDRVKIRVGQKCKLDMERYAAWYLTCYGMRTAFHVDDIFTIQRVEFFNGEWYARVVAEDKEYGDVPTRFLIPVAEGIPLEEDNGEPV